MNISEFKQWATKNGFILIITEAEVYDSGLGSEVLTNNKVYVFVSKTGSVVTLLCDEKDTIISAINDVKIRGE